MIFDTIPIPFGGKENATLSFYCPDLPKNTVLPKRPTVLVLPGGGYGNCSDREAEVIALRFATSGYNAAVLRYSVGQEAAFPQSLCEAAKAMAYLKENAERYQIDPARVYTCGFSAGGHLALSLGVFWHSDWLSEKVGKAKELLRPTAQIICYPVVTSDESFTHRGSIANLVRGQESPELRALVSLENQVTPETPPTFLWTTQTDKTVPYRNSVALLNALMENGVKTEFHLYGWGPHGLSLSDRTIQTVQNLAKSPENRHINPHVATWFPLCFEWLEFQFGAELLPAPSEN